jgi:hypothetical protein
MRQIADWLEKLGMPEYVQRGFAAKWPQSARAPPAPPAQRHPRGPSDTRNRQERHRPYTSQRSRRNDAPSRRRISDRPQ